MSAIGKPLIKYIMFLLITENQNFKTTETRKKQKLSYSLRLNNE